MQIDTGRLKELRERQGKTQKQIAEEIGCVQKTYSQYETRQRDLSTDILCKIADIHKVSVDYLLGRTDKEKPYPPAKED